MVLFNTLTHTHSTLHVTATAAHTVMNLTGALCDDLYTALCDDLYTALCNDFYTTSCDDLYTASYNDLYTPPAMRKFISAF